LPPYRTLAAELNFCNAGAQGCGRISQAINGLALAEKRPSKGSRLLVHGRKELLVEGLANPEN
jgi:hypothetical protein